MAEATRIVRPAAAPNPKTIPRQSYFTWLLAIFTAWKSLLLIIAYASPGPGYDTSTRILFEHYHDAPPPTWLAHIVQDLTLRLTRWDALYFTTSSERGHLFEQEWAFSWFMARLTAFLSDVFTSSIHPSPIIRHALTGAVISHISHLGAVLTLYALVRRIIPSNEAVKQRIAFAAACLHVVSPASLFLSSPYGESTFAFAAFLGIVCYIRAQGHKNAPIEQQSLLATATWTVLSGSAFAISALIRSNGLLHGTIFLFDAFTSLRAFLVTRKITHLFHLVSTVSSGTLIAFAFALPQAIAYTEFCTPSNTNTRPWCTRTIPSIYSWVQAHYWNVGFLAYWTPGNIPLFLLAAPMLVVLAGTAILVYFEPSQVLEHINHSVPSQTMGKRDADSALFTHITAQLALPQLILAIMALTSFHVQIINRISSGCALWYLVLAIAVNDVRSNDRTSRRSGGPAVGAWSMLFKGRRTEVLVRLMVGYAVVQGGLYASFLPPA